MREEVCREQAEARRRRVLESSAARMATASMKDPALCKHINNKANLNVPNDSTRDVGCTLPPRECHSGSEQLFPGRNCIIDIFFKRALFAVLFLLFVWFPDLGKHTIVLLATSAHISYYVRTFSILEIIGYVPKVLSLVQQVGLSWFLLLLWTKVVLPLAKRTVWRNELDA